MKSFILVLIFLIVQAGSNPRRDEQKDVQILTVQHDQNAGTIAVFRNGDQKPLLIQNAKEKIRPYIHPILAPDGNGVITEFSPAHHKHQTGLYWGLKQVNGRDYFMNWQGDYWRRIAASVTEGKGQKVKWKIVYDLLDEKGSAILREIQYWSMQETDGKFLLDLEWRGEAKIDITMEKFYVGGLFLRMPWRPGIPGEVINADGKRNGEAEGQRAIWNDIGIRVDGREDLAHIAILDHPDNADHPVPWRVDNELGIGPSRQISGDWNIRKGETEVIRYRLIVYTGAFSEAAITRSWKEYSAE